MARYFFHYLDQHGHDRDEDGLELPDLEAAIAEALRGIRSVFSDDATKGQIDLDGSIEITDSGGQQRFVVPFAEAIDIRLPGGTWLVDGKRSSG